MDFSKASGGLVHIFSSCGNNAEEKKKWFFFFFHDTILPILTAHKLSYLHSAIKWSVLKPFMQQFPNFVWLSGETEGSGCSALLSLWLQSCSLKVLKIWNIDLTFLIRSLDYNSRVIFEQKDKIFQISLVFL